MQKPKQFVFNPDEVERISAVFARVIRVQKYVHAMMEEIQMLSRIEKTTFNRIAQADACMTDVADDDLNT